MANSELLTVLTRIAVSLEKISESVAAQLETNQPSPSPPSGNTSTVERIEITETLQEASQLMQILKTRGIQVLNSHREEEKDIDLLRLSESIGKNYDLFTTVIGKIQKGGNFSLAMASYPNDNISLICQFALQLRDIGFIDNYNYQKSPKYKLNARAVRSKLSNDYFSKGWLNNYTFSVVKKAALSASSETAIKANLQFVFQPELQIEPNSKLNLDLLFTLNGQLYWIEARADEDLDDLDHLAGVSKNLGLNPDHAILVSTNTSFQKTLSKLLNLKALDIESLEDHLLMTFKLSLEHDRNETPPSSNSEEPNIDTLEHDDPIIVDIKEQPMDSKPIQIDSEMSFNSDSNHFKPEKNTESTPLPLYESIKVPTKKQGLSKAVLASYYTDARLNILACLNDIREKFQKKPMTNDDQIRAAFSSLNLSSVETERQNKMVKHLRRRFPFLDLLVDPNIEKSPKDKLTPLPHYYESNMSWMLELINQLRNTMVHPVDNELEISYAVHKKLYFALSKVYDSSFHTVKNRFIIPTEQISPFKRCDSEGKPKKYQDFSLALCKDPKGVEEASVLPQSRIFHDFGHILFCSLFLEKKQSAELINHFWDTPHGVEWHDTEHRTIIREMASIFRVRMPLQRLRSDDTSTAVTLDTLSELARCPRILLDRISSEDQERFRGTPGNGSHENDTSSDTTFLFARSKSDRFVSLMMRSLDFDPNNKLRFAVDLGQYYHNVRLKPATHFTDDFSRIRRLGNRILAYGKLADFEKAEKPPFWLQLEKNYTDLGEQEEQILNLENDEIQQLKPYIVQTHPHYYYTDDKIGFKIDKTDFPASYPSLNIDVQTANSHTCLEPISKQAMIPDFWMSKGQLLHVAFYNFLQNALLQQGDKSYLAIDVVLTRYRSGIVRMFRTLNQENVMFEETSDPQQKRDLAQQWIDRHFDNKSGEQFQVSLSNLPKVVINHLLGNVSESASVPDVIARASNLLDETQRKLKQLENQVSINKKRGQKGFRAIKCGNIGDFLAEDLIRFQAVNPQQSNGGKLNSQQYQILQAALAYYGAHIDKPPTIIDLLTNSGLLGGKFPHPFLNRLDLENQPDRYQGLIGFYEAYLHARKCYIQEFITEHQHRTHINFVPQWLRLRQRSTIQSWLDEQLDAQGNPTQPIPLTQNMLYLPILSMLAKSLGKTPEAIELEGTQYLTHEDQEIPIKPAITWLIQYYLESCDDSPQAMYSYPRQHELISTWLDDRSDAQKFQEKNHHYLPEWKRMNHVDNIRNYLRSGVTSDPTESDRHLKLGKLLKAYKRDERLVRYAISQDMLLYLTARNNLDNLQLVGLNKDSTPDWSLSNLELSLLKTEIRFLIQVPKTNKQLLHPHCKIRDIGEMTLLAKDLRLPSLFAYYKDDETELNHAEIHAELNSYRRAKVVVMDKIHELEHSINSFFSSVPERTKLELENSQQLFGKGRHGDFLFQLMTYYRDIHSTAPDKEFTDESIKRSLLIRNAFSHNTYPDVEQFQQVAAKVHTEISPENPANNRKIAERLQEELEELYRPWIAFITNQKRRKEMI